MFENKIKLLKDNHHEYIDLSSILTSNDEYVCEQCGIRLLLYPQAHAITPLSRGPSYICPKCHMITDSSLTSMQHEDKIKPFDVAVPAFAIVPEKKGTEILFESARCGNNDHDHDPESQEEEILKAKGATIISKRIDAKSDFG